MQITRQVFRRIGFVSGICALLLFTVFSFGIKKGAMRSMDFAVTVKLQDAVDRSPKLRLSRFIGDVMEGATFFASPEWSVGMVLLLTIVLALDFRNRRLRWLAVSIPILFVLLVLAEIYGKSVVHHPAPPFFMIKNPTTMFPKYYINDEFSYPSGHVGRAVFLATLMILACFRPLGKRKILMSGVCILAGLYVLMVAVSRIYLGHHWLSDCIGGALIGWGTVGFVVAGLL